MSVVLLDPDQALGGEVGEQAVHGLARPADHRRQLGLGERPREADLAVGVRVGLAGHPHDPARQAAGQVEEVELPDVVGEAAQLADEAREQRAPQAGVLVDQAVEGVAAEDERLGGLERDRGGGVLRAVEQGQLAEEVARAEGRDDRALLALGVGQDDLHGAGLDDVERVAGVALVEDRLVPPVAPAAQRSMQRASVSSSSREKRTQRRSASAAFARSSAAT